jgi:DNA replication protein DnaC
MARTCPFDICDGSGLLVDETTREASYCRCHAQVVASRRAAGLSAVIPRKYRDLSFDRPPITDIQATPAGAGVVSAVRRFATKIDQSLDDGRGLWLGGPVGTGKTSLAMLVSGAALSAGRAVAIYSLPRLLAEIRETFEDSSHSSYAGFLDRLASVDLLHIDDVGAEKTSPWVIEQLYAIVNRRYEDERSIVITTNLGRDKLIEQIEERTVSRLEEMCEVLPLGGSDKRAQTYTFPKAS